MKPMIQMAKTASNLVAANRRVVELEAKLTGLEKRAEVEQFLISMIEDAHAPSALRPTSIRDFLEKRAAIEKQDLEVAKLAAKMVSSQGFEIGDPEQPTPLQSGGDGSLADQMFTDYLLGSDQG